MNNKKYSDKNKAIEMHSSSNKPISMTKPVESLYLHQIGFQFNNAQLLAKISL